MSEKYNGYSNYATWRINLEIFSSDELHIDLGVRVATSPYIYGKILEDYLYDFIEEGWPEESLVKSYCIAFLKEVDFTDIANTHMSDYNN